MGFSRQEYWSGLPFLSPGDLPDPGIKSRSPALQADSLLTELRSKCHCIKSLHWMLINWIFQSRWKNVPSEKEKKKEKKCSLKVTHLTDSQNISCIYHYSGFPGGAIGKESAYRCRRHKRVGLIFGSGKIPWRRKWQPTPVFLPGESHGQRSLLGYSTWGCKKSDVT